MKLSYLVAFCGLLGAIACGSSSSNPTNPGNAGNTGDGSAGTDASTQETGPDAASPDSAPNTNDATLDGPVDDRTAMVNRMRDVVKYLSVDLFPRSYKNVEHLDAAALMISEKLKATTGNSREQTYQYEGNTYRNIIATVGPDTNERIVVGAHYDAVENAPGADDNASAVAGLIELSAMLAKDTLPVKVELVAFTLEEPPTFRSPSMGSAVHAADLASNKIPVVAMIAIEMIGYYSDQPNSQEYPIASLSKTYGNVGDFIAVIGRTDQKSFVDGFTASMTAASPLPAKGLAAPTFIEGIDFSDHLNYWAHNWNALMVTDTANFRNKSYHKPTDTMDKLDFDKMVDVVHGIHAAVLGLANNK